jgi:hypothetical protein
MTGYYYIHVYGAGSAQNTYSLTTSVEAPSCDDDDFENNDSFSNATHLTLGWGDNNYNGLQVCSGDEDWYKMYLVANEHVDVYVNFDDDQGDIDLYFYDWNQILVDDSTSTSDNESVFIDIQQTGYFYIRVIGYSGAQNGYDMRIYLE